MPPILLLDTNFYGKISQDKNGDFEKLKIPAPAPESISNVRVTNKEQRNEVKQKLTENINDPNATDKPAFTAEYNKKDVEKLKASKDLGSRFVSFLQTPIVETTDEAKEQQQKREIQRIVPSADAVINEIRPIGEVPIDLGNKVVNFIEKEFLKIILLVGGLYIAGQVVSGATKGVVDKAKKSVSD